MLQLSSNAAKLVSKDSLTQWLGFYSSTVGDLGSIPGWEPKILQAAHTAKKKKKKKEIHLHLQTGPYSWCEAFDISTLEPV